MSSVACAIPFSVLSMEFEAVSKLNSRDFFLSSDPSNWSSQYSFLCSSSSCSSFNMTTISSIILMTFSSPNFLPWIASATKSRSPLGNLPCASRMRARARARRTAEALPPSCAKLALDGPGSVFLNSSRASSSFRILIVSAMASSSSWRVFWRSSHSAAFEPQLFCRSAMNFWSSTSCAWVSVRSFSIWTISTANWPTRWVFDSMLSVKAFTSFALAAISSS
mmetsp:Transcript_1788/g.4571  ORF Transcript_1788/g.4571 Transcript_1788/m.4571 type:complete len:222 (+) Transcript_1788:920-1585(+)